MSGRSPISADEALEHTEWVSRLARALVGSPDGAEDLAQDAWEAAVDRGEPPPSELRAWMTGVLRNLAAMRARTNARRIRREAAASSDQPVPQPDEVVERLRTQQLVAKLVLDLNEPIRAVLFLRYYEGLSATEIGQRLSIPPGTVRRRLKSGVDELRAQLDHTFEGDRRRWMGLLIIPAALLLRPGAAAAAGGILQGALMMKANKVVVGLIGVGLAAVLVGAWWLWSPPDAKLLDWTHSQAEYDDGQRLARSSPDADSVDPSTLGRGPGRLPAWLGQPEAPRRRVAGRVISAGVPVSGAIVRLEPHPLPEGEALMRLAPRPLPLGLSTPELRTSANGAFDFGERLPFVHTVSASAAGLSGATVEVDLRDPEAAPIPEALELVLTGCDARLVGHVLDSAGGPIGHGRVLPASGAGVETDERGGFELCLPPGENTLHVDANGYGGLRLTVLVSGRVARDIVLTPEAIIVGQVVDDRCRIARNSAARFS